MSLRAFVRIGVQDRLNEMFNTGRAFRNHFVKLFALESGKLDEIWQVIRVWPGFFRWRTGERKNLGQHVQLALAREQRFGQCHLSHETSKRPDVHGI